MKIRKFEKKDLERVKELFVEGYKDPPYNEKWPKDLLDKRINEYLDNDIFVIEIDNKVQGFIILGFYAWYTGLRGYISELVVSSESQGKGYGKALMDYAEDFIKKAGAKSVCLGANKKAKAFNMYKKRNYKEDDYVNLCKEFE